MAPAVSAELKKHSSNKRKSESGPSKENVAKKSRVSEAPEEAHSGHGEEEVEEQAETALSKSFKDLGIIDSLCEACEKMGFKKP